MTVALGSRTDITLDVFERVAWRGEPIRVSSEALVRVDAARAAFLRLLAQPDVTIYGVTSGYGDRAGVRLDAEGRRRQAAVVALVAASFGEPLPERVVRGIVLARLANFLDGNAAVSARLVEGVAVLLDGRPLPPVPAQGNGGSGEILALSHLFGPLTESADLGEKEGIALVNGSPCAAALVADAALAAERRLQLAYDVFATSIEAFQAPLDAYDVELESLWGDACEGRALRRLRARLDDKAERRAHQGPVAYRILPRVLGQVERSLAAAREVAAVSLRSVSDNPVYLPPSGDHPDGRVLSTGGYHNAAAPAALHQLAVCWADLCQLAERHVERLLFDQKEVHFDGSRMLLMVAVGYAEEARSAAQPVIMARSGPGQDDVTSPSFLAWSREQVAGDCLSSALAVLAAAAAYRALPQRSVGRDVGLVRAGSRPVVADIEEGRAFGNDLGLLADRFRERVLAPIAAEHDS
ncbi:MAG: aromatic amino acid lyase [Thermoleophilia bacterium]|nr:aromatic amino acid lyase [Thermoleophilia bacterium]